MGMRNRGKQQSNTLSLTHGRKPAGAQSVPANRQTAADWNDIQEFDETFKASQATKTNVLMGSVDKSQMNKSMTMNTNQKGGIKFRWKLQKQKEPLIDVPDELPEDAFLKTTKAYFDNIHGPMAFEKQRPHAINLTATNVNENRFEQIYDISQWNGKYNSVISYNFMQLPRNTEAPGTLKPVQIQKEGKGHDHFVDCDAHVGKRSLTLGMVDFKRTMDRAEFDKKLQHGKLALYEGIIGAGPGAYEPEKVRNGYHLQSSIKQEKSFVPFSRQIARVQHGSIYTKAPGESANERSLTPSKREQLRDIKIAQNLEVIKQEILKRKECNRHVQHNRNHMSQTADPSAPKRSRSPFKRNSMRRDSEPIKNSQISY